MDGNLSESITRIGYHLNVLFWFSTDNKLFIIPYTEEYLTSQPQNLLYKTLISTL